MYFFVPVKFEHSNYFSGGSCPVCWVSLRYFCPDRAVEPVVLVSLVGAKHLNLLQKLGEKRCASDISILQPGVSLLNREKKENRRGG